MSGSEFITEFLFGLNGGNPALFGLDPTGSPDFNFGSCSGDTPAGIGPWDLCVGFSLKGANHFNLADDTFTAHLPGATESNFAANGSGYWTVAHIQGIKNSCSGWVSGDNVIGGGTGVGDGSCTPSVPEPGTLALLGIGMLGLGMSRRRVEA